MSSRGTLVILCLDMTSTIFTPWKRKQSHSYHPPPSQGLRLGRTHLMLHSLKCGLTGRPKPAPRKLLCQLRPSHDAGGVPRPWRWGCSTTLAPGLPAHHVPRLPLQWLDTCSTLTDSHPFPPIIVRRREMLTWRAPIPRRQWKRGHKNQGAPSLEAMTSPLGTPHSPPRPGVR